MDAKAAAHGNGNAVRGTIDKASKHCGARNHIRSATGGENTMAASGDNILEGVLQIRSGIERPVECEFEWMRQLNECASTFHVNGAAGEEYTNNHTCGTDAPSIFNLLAHDGERHCVVIEASGVRPHQNVNGYFAGAHDTIDQRPRRREAVHRERGAELDAIRSTVLRGMACFKRLSRNFEYDWAAQEKYPRRIDSRIAPISEGKLSLTLTNKVRLPHHRKLPCWRWEPRPSFVCLDPGARSNLPFTCHCVSSRNWDPQKRK